MVKLKLIVRLILIVKTYTYFKRVLLELKNAEDCFQNVVLATVILSTNHDQILLLLNPIKY